MKSKIFYLINFVWSAFTTFFATFCFGWIFLDISGHSKGYSYDLGAEKDISVMLGCIELLVWLGLTLPSTVYVLRRTARRSKGLLLGHLALYGVMAAVGLFTIYGSWNVFSKEIFNV